MKELKFYIVDDMNTIRKLVAYVLKNAGINNYNTFEDGSYAWKALLDVAGTPAQPDFIISDWNMPIMKGVELLKNCRSHAAYKDIAFLMLTAEQEAHIVKEVILAGVDGYIVKPFVPNVFLQKIQQIYEKKFIAAAPS